MPTQQEVDQVKQNVQDLRVFFNSIYTGGVTVISSVFASLGRSDDIDLHLQTTLNLYSNALVTTESVVSNYLAASVAGYRSLTPESLSGTFSSVADCFQKTYLEADAYLINIENDPASCWYNTCTGIIYTPTSTSTLSVVQNELSTTQFIKSTDADYTDKVNLALAALEASLRNAFQ
jgi:hypothetical protein